MSNQRNNGFSADEMIEVCNLEKSFGDRPVLKDISFSARPGELIALLGPNGAGKTTLMRILCGYLPLDAGTVQFDGIGFAAGRQQILKQVGYMPENVPLYSEMTVYEYLRFVAGIYRMKKKISVVRLKRRRPGWKSCRCWIRKSIPCPKAINVAPAWRRPFCIVRGR